MTHIITNFIAAHSLFVALAVAGALVDAWPEPKNPGSVQHYLWRAAHLLVADLRTALKSPAKPGADQSQ